MEIVRYVCYDHFGCLNMLERSIHNITKQLHRGLLLKIEVVIKETIVTFARQKVHNTHLEAPHK